MSAIFITASTFTAPSSQSRKLHKPNQVCAKRLDFFEKFDGRRSFCVASTRKDLEIMTGLNGFPSSTSGEGFQAFEQEDLIEGNTLNLGAGGTVEATLNTLSKWVVSILFGALILWRHDAEALWAAMGAVLNAILSVTLKKILNQERPMSTLRSTSKSDPGMPSSHAQAIFYTITFVNASLVEFYGVNGLTTTLCGLFFIIGSYFSWLRISQQFHTVSQVVVGGVLGTIFSVFWFWWWNTFVLNLYVSSLWVRILIVTSAIGFCGGFLHHVYKTWIMDER
ncbi:hypothetical protein ACJIZ3_002132 [Penstemon smallii]|uniref:Phosphatidic acid phosphatase type 2/haloperoxidase domain-containing protein n=1 Tax=Penstemon smallii TaxID=265156 RepID=A0ABD3U5L7_9LAMI